MKRAIHCISAGALVLLVLALWSGFAFAQDPSGQAPGDQSSSPGSGGAPPAATGVDTQGELTENPPLSGLDQPSFEPGYGARSYLVPSAQLSESLSSNPSASVNNTSGVSDVTRMLGSLDLQKLWKIHPLDIAYIGGAAWFHGGNRTRGWYQIHTMDAAQRILWRTGQLAIRDSFSYMPQGGFGFGSFGGAGGFGGIGGFGSGGLGTGGGVFGGPTIGTNGNSPRIDNMGIVDVTQAISPRSSVTMAGGFGVLHFFNSPPGFINSQQTIAQAGYNYALSRKDQIAISYAFQEFHFPVATAGDLNVNLWQVYYAHRISGRLDFNVGGGPQWIHTNGFAPVNIFGTIILIPLHTSRISGAGRAGLTYRWSSRTNMALNYFHYITPGSGFYAGASSDVVRYIFNRQLTRRWGTGLDTGFSRSTRVLNPTSASSAGGNSHSYDYWYVGGTAHRKLSRQFQVFASYQYDKLLFSSGFRANGAGARYGRHVGTVGIDWTPRPIRLD